jgi:HSP20 family protein
MLVRFDNPRTLDNLLENFFATDVLPSRNNYPLIDVTEQDGAVTVIAELPGLKKEEVKITFENGVLTLQGERKPYEIPDDARVLMNEMRVRNFSRSIPFEYDIDASKISAELVNGILKIMLPKAESAKARTIEVK